MDINTLEEKLGIANLSDAEKLALVKGIESNVQASKAAVKAQEAGQYASLVVDAIKRIKNDLETRFNELNGIIDVKANSLQDGKDGLQGAKGEKGDRGFDGTNGKDGYNGKDGIDGVDGKDGVGVRDAYIDFDGSLIIKLTDGTEINVGEVVPMDVAEKIKVIGNGGGTSQSVLDSLESLQDQINTLTGIDGELGTMAQQNANSVAITGGTINGTTVGATTPAAGTFTTLTANSTSQFGRSSANYVQVTGNSTGLPPVIRVDGSDTNANIVITSKGSGGVQLWTNGVGSLALNASHTASAVNYVQVTGAATGNRPTLSAQGSDTNIPLDIQTKGTGHINFTPNRTNYLSVYGAGTGGSPQFLVAGTDTNIDLTLTPKGTGNVRFGTYTADMTLVVQGYITIKDSGGTVRKLAVIA